MSHESPSANQDTSLHITKILLEKMSEVEPADIANFRQQIKHDFDIFDKLDPSQQEAIAAIYKMNDDELAMLAEQGQRYLPGVHDVSQYLTVICGLTEDPRFEKLTDKKE